MKKIIGALQFVGMVLVFVVGIFALMSSGCATYHGTLNTPRGRATPASTSILGGMFSSTTDNFNSVEALAACITAYHQQQASGGGTVPNVVGTCTNDIVYGQPHPTMPMWGFGGMYNNYSYNPFAPTAGAPGVRW